MNAFGDGAMALDPPASQEPASSGGFLPGEMGALGKDSQVVGHFDDLFL
jgi:hypothetical protein